MLENAMLNCTYNKWDVYQVVQITEISAELVK
jgi:hypothetical protein